MADDFLPVKARISPGMSALSREVVRAKRLPCLCQHSKSSL